MLRAQLAIAATDDTTLLGPQRFRNHTALPRTLGDKVPLHTITLENSLVITIFPLQSHSDLFNQPTSLVLILLLRRNHSATSLTSACAHFVLGRVHLPAGNLQ